VAMEWLREVREQNADEEIGMTVVERLARTETGAHELLEKMLANPSITVRPGGQWRAHGTTSEANR
jgi:hypothetical protein